MWYVCLSPASDAYDGVVGLVQDSCWFCNEYGMFPCKLGLIGNAFWAHAGFARSDEVHCTAGKCISNLVYDSD